MHPNGEGGGGSAGGAAALRLEVRPSIGALSHDWDALVQRCRLPSPFLSSWWIDHATARERVVLAVHEDDRLCGGAAFEIDDRGPVRRYMAVGEALGVDHIDLVAAPGDEARVGEAIRSWTTAHRDAVFDLTLVNPAGSLQEAIPGARIDVVEAAPFVMLPPDPDAYLAERPSQLRNTLARTAKRLAKAGVTYSVGSASEVEDDLATLRDLHERVFGRTSQFLPHFDRFACAARAGCAAGEVRFHRLHLGDEAIAVTVMLESAGRTSYYQVGRRTEHEWRGSGALLELRIIEDACRRGLREFDHLRGTASYKDDWAPDRRPLGRLRASRGIGGRSLAAATSAATWLKRLRSR